MARFPLPKDSQDVSETLVKGCELAISRDAFRLVTWLASAASASASPPPRSPAAKPVASSSPRTPPAPSPTATPRTQTAGRARSRTPYILDEPTSGLHFDDAQRPLSAFREFVEGGGSLLVIEHNLDIIKSVDWVVDMGPEGGSAGGEIVATGTPEQIAGNSPSHTGHYLAAGLTQKTNLLSS